MIIYDFDIVRAGTAPLKTDSPLPVDSDAVLPLAISLQGFKPVPGRDAKLLETNRSIEQLQLIECFLLDTARQSPRQLAVPNLLRLRALKTDNQPELFYNRGYIRQKDNSAHREP
jgi:hypothetical protein